jgi:hypothetical protein
MTGLPHLGTLHIEFAGSVSPKVKALGIGKKESSSQSFCTLDGLVLAKLLTSILCSLSPSWPFTNTLVFFFIPIRRPIPTTYRADTAQTCKFETLNGLKTLLAVFTAFKFPTPPNFEDSTSRRLADPPCCSNSRYCTPLHWHQ